VGLAAVTVNSDGTIAQIDNCSCRRLVLSFSRFWWKCTGTLSGITVSDPTGKTTAGNPIPVKDGDTNATQITVKATNLDQNATFTFGDGLTITTDNSQWTAANRVITLSVLASANAQPGLRPLIVVNADCSTAIAPNAINVVAADTAATGTLTPAPAGRRAVTNKPKKVTNKPQVG
jgi:hypothetical protein